MISNDSIENLTEIKTKDILKRLEHLILNDYQIIHRNKTYLLNSNLNSFTRISYSIHSLTGFNSIQRKLKLHASFLQYAADFDAAALGMLNRIKFKSLNSKLLVIDYILDRHVTIQENIRNSTRRFKVSDSEEEINLLLERNDVPVDNLNDFLIANILLKLDSFSSITRFYGEPGLFGRYYPTILIGLTTLYFSNRVINSTSFLQFSNTIYQTSIAFLENWILTPLINIYKTIRYKDQRIITSNLSSDLQSLERMVTQFSLDHNLAQSNHLDMTPILTRYEHEIKNPIKNILSGDLIQCLLIQIQKTKVDGAIAIEALDKLLASNELNFAFIAVLPTLWILNVVLQKVYHVSRNLMNSSDVKLSHQVVKCLNEMDRILNKQELNLIDEGRLKCEISMLNCFSKRFGVEGDSFRSDLQDLESLKFTASQKLRVLDRIYRSLNSL